MSLENRKRKKKDVSWNLVIERRSGMKKHHKSILPGSSRRLSETFDEIDPDIILNSPTIENMPGMYSVWVTLPESVQRDPSFEPFRRYGMRLVKDEANAKVTNNSASKKKRSCMYEGVSGTKGKSGLSSKSETSDGHSSGGESNGGHSNGGEGSSGLSNGSKNNGGYSNGGDSNIESSSSHFLDVPKVVVGSMSSSSHMVNQSCQTSVLVEPEEEEFKDVLSPTSLSSKLLNFFKVSFLISVWVFSCVILMLVKSDSDINNAHQISIPPNITRSYWILENPTMCHIQVELEGAILPPYYANLTTRFMRLWIDLIQTRIPRTNISEQNIFYRRKISETWIVPVVSEESIDFAPEVRQTKLFEIKEVELDKIPHSLMCLEFSTNLKSSFPISLSYDLAPIDPKDGIVFAALILFGLYFLIISEIVHRTVAAMLGATVSVAVLAMFGERPSHQEIVSWVDLETLTLLFSMMVFVAIFSETGIFDYLAVVAYQASAYFSTHYRFFQLMGGRIWMLINILCINTVLVSTLLDNVTTILLMTPVTIRLCEVMDLNPTPVLMAMIVFSNIGGAITPIGDPPNVIIATNKDVVSSGVTFAVFTCHMGLALTIIMVFVHFQLRFMFRNMRDLQYSDPLDVQDLRHEIVIWQRAAASLSSITREEEFVRRTLMKKVQQLLFELKQKLMTGSDLGNYREDVEEMSRRFPIRDKALLFKSLFTLGFVVVTFVLLSVLHLHLSMASVALLGALLLLLLDREDIVDVLARVEWSTLIFFTSLFILMEGLSRLGLIDFIGHQTEVVITAVEPGYRLAAAILLILWVSAFASSFLDNIPLTTMMIRIAVTLNQNEKLALPLQPLVWALALGACLGGNGTLIGASSNLVCACLAERHGYKFTFMQFSRIGFPVMLWSLVVATAYLMIVHVWLEFNG